MSHRICGNAKFCRTLIIRENRTRQRAYIRYISVGKFLTKRNFARETKELKEISRNFCMFFGLVLSKAWKVVCNFSHLLLERYRATKLFVVFLKDFSSK